MIDKNIWEKARRKEALLLLIEKLKAIENKGGSGVVVGLRKQGTYTLLAGVLVAVLLVGAGYFIFHKKPMPPSEGLSPESPLPDFSGEAAPITALSPKTSNTLPTHSTPAPYTTMSNDITPAREALIAYFNLLNTKKYEAAMTYHGSGYEILRFWNPSVRKDDYATLLRNGCEINGWQCLPIKNVLDQKQISQFQIKFVVQFEKLDKNYNYIVQKIGANFIVITPPIYIP